MKFLQDRKDSEALNYKLSWVFLHHREPLLNPTIETKPPHNTPLCGNPKPPQRLSTSPSSQKIVAELLNQPVTKSINFNVSFKSSQLASEPLSSERHSQPQGLNRFLAMRLLSRTNSLVCLDPRLFSLNLLGVYFRLRRSGLRRFCFRGLNAINFGRPSLSVHGSVSATECHFSVSDEYFMHGPSTCLDSFSNLGRLHTMGHA